MEEIIKYIAGELLKIDPSVRKYVTIDALKLFKDLEQPIAYGTPSMGKIIPISDFAPRASIENVSVKPISEPVTGEAITEQELMQLMQCINDPSLSEESRKLFLKQLYNDEED